MKKVTSWIFAISLLVLIVSFGAMGVKIFNGNYKFALEAHIGLAAFFAFFASIIIMKFSSAKCPRCGKTQLQLDKGKYCLHCGKELSDKS